MAAEAAKGKKTRVIYPTSTAASDLRTREFSLRHPLLQIAVSRVTKFQDGKQLDSEVCDYFLREAMTQMDDFGKCYSRDGSPIGQELHYRPVACSLFPVFTRLAPKSGELLEGEDPKHGKKDSVAGFQQTATGVVMEDVTGNALWDSFMSGDSDLSGWSFSDGCFHHEDGSTLKPHEAVDCRGYVMDMNLLSSVSRSVFEMKAIELWPATLQQGLYYGAGAAMENTKLGRFKKVYVVVMGIGWAGVAEIDPVGCLEVGEKNVITASSAAQFKRQVEGKCAYLVTKGKKDESDKLKNLYLGGTDDELADKLHKEMRSKMENEVKFLNASAKENTVYSSEFPKATWILLGRVNYRREPYNLLRYPLYDDGDLTVKDDRTVISGIARIIYGNRALKWKLAQVEKLARERREDANNKVKTIMARPRAYG